MIEFYATLLVESEDKKQEFETELIRNSIIIKGVTPESDTCFHYCLQGEWASYSFVASLSLEEPRKFELVSVEHFEN